MSITRYVTGDSEGVIALTARAFDPDGNPIIQQFSVSVNPLPIVPKCYTSVQALSPVQQDISSACAQFGIANTYYLGTPRNTFYLDDSCSNIAPDGFYKTENGNWVNISGGVIRQQGSCASARVGATLAPTPRQFFNAGGVTNITPPVATRIAGEVIQTFIPETTFTPPSPTTVKPDVAFIAERAAAKAAQRAAELPQQILTTTVSNVVNTPTNIRQTVSTTPIAIPTFTPAVTPAPTPVFGCVDPTATNYNPNATVDDGSCQYQRQGGFTTDSTEQFI